MPDIVRLANGLRDEDARTAERGQPLATGAIPIPSLANWLALDPAQRPPQVWLAPDADLTVLATQLAGLQLIALDFPKSGDGRPYSLAALLRMRYGYRGELRAIGDVAIDQFNFLRRLGFDSVELAPRHVNATTLATIRRVLARFSDAYQGSVDEPLPAYRRHARPVRERELAHR
jgi:uncharacterized protein (DUF934 family)